MLGNQWHLCLEVHNMFYLVTTYSITLPVFLGVCTIWSLVCLCKHWLNSLVVTNLFYLDRLECSHSWREYAVHSILTGCDASHQVCVLYSWVCVSWMLPEWTTVCHSTPHNLKEFQSSLVVWGNNSGKWRRNLSLARSKRMHVESTPSSGKHQSYGACAGHFAYCSLRV